MNTTRSLPVVLASTSPFRKELLQRLGITFTAAAPDVDESPLAGETPDVLVRRLAEARPAQSGNPALDSSSDQTRLPRQVAIFLANPARMHALLNSCAACLAG